MKNKPLASVSLDLDNKWTYLRRSGDPDWEGFPSYFGVLVPRLLDFFDERDLKITFFVVGQDAELKRNHVHLKSLANSGHEIANHSFMHDPWLHRYSQAELEEDFSRAEAAIHQATGQLPIGFRAPGFNLSRNVLKTMGRRGYDYDGSTYPTFWGPITRACHFLKNQFGTPHMPIDQEHSGRFQDARQPNSPYQWSDINETLIEIPVTTLPYLKTPVHGSYLTYLGGTSPWLAKAYFMLTLKLCKWSGVEPSLLLQPLDFLGEEDEPDLNAFPTMTQSAKQKIDLLTDCMNMLTNHFNVVTVAEHCQSASAEDLPLKSVDLLPQGVTSGERVAST